MNCIHCSRGDSQNFDMSDEVLYKSLDNLSTIEEYLKGNGACPSLYLYGGEPFLCPEIIHKIVEYIISKNIFLMSFWVITNGTILSDEIAKDFQRIQPYIDKCRKIFEENLRESGYKEELFPEHNDSVIKISYCYHDKEQSEKAYDFYKKYKGIKVDFFDKKIEQDFMKTLSYRGRAKQLIDRKDIYFQITNNHCMATDLTEKFVNKTLCVSANGNVFLGLDYEYQFVDNDNMGNVLNESIYDMAIKWNYKNPLTTDEMKKYRKINNILFNYDNGWTGEFRENQKITEDMIEDLNNRKFIYDELVRIRKLLHAKYDSLPIKDIVYFGDTIMEVDSNGSYMRNFYDEEKIKDYDFEAEKQAMKEGIESLPYYNDNFFYEKEENKHLKNIILKYPCLNRQECIDMEYALNRLHKDISCEEVKKCLDIIKKLKVKYFMFDMTVDEEIENQLNNSGSGLWKLGRSFMQLCLKLGQQLEEQESTKQ